MTLAPGTRLGAYEITAPIGAGGMGEVYRARDTRLNRDVAIKALPEAFATDPDRLARFKREAHVLASLNHPHIAAIYGLEETASANALVLELVEGPTLADRIAQGPIPLDEALPIAKQICEALEAAHERGIIHRDLKPANIKLTPDGAVKVLDFGLAKAVLPDSSNSSEIALTDSPTITSPIAMSGIGVLLGTAAYMSPEQARGKPVDKRSDIWAFGCVLYEMLTGSALHSGQTVSDVLASVIVKPVNWSSLPMGTPVHVHHLLERCLEKEPRQRLRDIGEARIALHHPQSESEQRYVTRDRSQSLVPFITFVAGVAIAAIAAFLSWPSPEPLDSPKVFAISAPEGVAFVIPGPMLALSPDGRTLAFIAVDSQGRRMLWHRALDAREAVLITGTEDASDPFWSPDSTRVGFFAKGKLMSVDVASGRLRAITDIDQSNGGAWNTDDTILFAHVTQGLYRVPASGGKPETVIGSETSRTERGWRTPTFLPDGQRFLYIAQEEGKTGWRAFVGDLQTRQSRYLFDADSKVEYAQPGWVFYQANGRLVAQRFNTGQAAIIGESIPLASDLLGATVNARKAFTVSSAGLLAFRERPTQSRLIVLNRNGRQVSTIGQVGDRYPVALSADNKFLAFRRNDDIWSADLETGKERRLSFTAPATTPVWSPDDRSVAYLQFSEVYSSDPIRKLWRMSLDGTTAPQEFPTVIGALTQWLPDGTGFLLESGNRLLVNNLDGKSRATIDNMPAATRDGEVSPDGRWIAYAAAERGDFQVYVQAFPSGQRKWQISGAGGRQPRWKADGTELFYLDASGYLTAAAVRTSGQFDVLGTDTLFEIGASTGLPGGVGYFYDVTNDGQRFIFSTELMDQIRTPITVVLNWQELLERPKP